MTILKRALSMFVVLQLFSAEGGEVATMPRRVPVSLFPNAKQVWLYAEPPQPGDVIRGASINSGPRFLLSEREVQQLRDAVYELDLRTVNGDTIVADSCIHPLKYVFGFEDANGNILGFFEVFADNDQPDILPSRPYRRDFLLLVERPVIEEVAAHHLSAQVIADLNTRRHCG